MEPADKFGWSVAGGDVNGDGKNDIIVSALFASEDYLDSGGVYVYYGGKKISARPDVTFSGDDFGAGIGYCVAAGDINGDGIADLFFDRGHEVQIYYGSKKFAARMAKNKEPDVIIHGRAPTDSGHTGSGFGRAIAYLGDFDGDGLGDFAIGQPRTSVPSPRDGLGSVYIFKGSKKLPSEIYESETDYRISKIAGASVGDFFGQSFSVVGDVNGRGTPDLLVGARWANDKGTLLTGKVYLFYGEDLIKSPTTVHTPSRAKKIYSIKTQSGEYGRVLAVSSVADSQVLFFTGAPFLDNHTGGAYHYKLKVRESKNKNNGETGSLILMTHDMADMSVIQATLASDPAAWDPDKTDAENKANTRTQTYKTWIKHGKYTIPMMTITSMGCGMHHRYNGRRGTLPRGIRSVTLLSVQEVEF